MEWKPRMWPTFAAEVLRARASLRLSDEIGLAFRAERQRLGMSQRAYAVHRGLTLGAVIRLESAADSLKLGDVDAALAGTGFQLCLCHRPPDPEPTVAAFSTPDPPRDDNHSSAADVTPGPSAGPSERRLAPRADPDTAPLPQPVHPAFWPRAELVARVRGGNRRFPAHHVTEQVDVAPPWWWYAESSRAGTKPPNWYAPQYTQRRPTAS